MKPRLRLVGGKVFRHDRSGMHQFISISFLMETLAAFGGVKPEWSMCRERDGEAANPGPGHRHDPFAEFLDSVPEDLVEEVGFGIAPAKALELDSLIPIQGSLGCMAGLFPSWADHSPVDPIETSVMAPSVASVHESGKVVGREWKKRRKHRSDGAAIVTFNGSCWATAKDFLERTEAHVVLCQETKLEGERKLDAETWAARTVGNLSSPLA